MDFIERWFGLNPDGGSGVIEAGILATLMALLGIVAVFASAERRQVCRRLIHKLQQHLMFRQ